MIWKPEESRQLYKKPQLPFQSNYCKINFLPKCLYAQQFGEHYHFLISNYHQAFV